MTKLLIISLFVMSCYITALYGNPVDGGIQLEPEHYDAMTSGNNTEMLENPDDNGVLTRSVGTNSRSKNWPNGVVPFRISSAFSDRQKQVIYDSMTLFNQKTDGCISFVERSNEPNGINIKPSQGCWSYVGKIGSWNEQDVSLQQNGCLYHGTVVHELMHAIGFHHEQNRPDRDSYIRVHMENIEEDQRHNFDKLTASNSETFGTSYDLDSVMQYENHAFSKNGQVVIEALNGKVLENVARRADENVMTANDIRAVKAMYSCNSGTISPVNPSETTQENAVVRIDNDLQRQLSIYVDGSLTSRLPGKVGNSYYYVTINTVTGAEIKLSSAYGTINFQVDKTSDRVSALSKYQ